MERQELIDNLRQGIQENREFLGTPREVAPLPKQEKFDWWGNIIEFYGIDKIQDFFSSMFQKEKFSERPTTIDPRYGKENMLMIKQILEE